MPSNRELTLATIFFALLALATLAFLRPLDRTEWLCLAVSTAFVVLGCLALWKGEALAARGLDRRRRSGRQGERAAAAISIVPSRSATSIAEPAPEERQVLATTIAALEDAGALVPGEVDASAMWQAAQHADPGHPVGFYEALASLAVLQELGRLTPRRLTFVPVHVEYDEELLAAITASILRSLGHDVEETDVLVALPRDGLEGEAAITFPIEGRCETVMCRFLWKDAPPELLEGLARLGRTEDPRDLVCADTGHQSLLFAAIRPGALAELNRRFPVEYEMFGEP